MRRRPSPLTVCAVAGVLALAGCGTSIPTDPNGTLERVAGGTLQVGISPNGEQTIAEDEGYSGSEVELVEGFADSIDAEIEWTAGTEAELVRQLEDRALDLVVGGFTDTTPWSDRVGVTRAYASVRDESGEAHKLVMLVQMGENAFLVELERYLSEHGGL
ncbi:transporter substrate-binding domain-containing protein [Okibacterium endophyticum]